MNMSNVVFRRFFKSVFQHLHVFFCTICQWPSDLISPERQNFTALQAEVIAVVVLSVPIAAGEQFGDRWDGTQPLVEQGLIDYLRVAIPNVGGITEYMKIAALSETHYIGLVPHFTAPIATAAVIHAVTVFPGPVLNEVLTSDRPDYLEEGYDFRNGKIYPNNRPGIGVVFNPGKTNLIDEITEEAPVSGYTRPDGSFTTL